MDWDEELKRQAAISALLAPPEDGQAPPLDTQTDEQVTAQPDVLQPDKSDWHKLANQVFPTIAEDQGASDKYPTIASDQPSGPPKNYPDISPPAPEPADVKTDEDTGTRYVQDPLEGKIPHAELASEADKEAFKPSDVTLPEETAIGTGAPIEVRRGERVLEMPKPTPESAAPPLPPGIIPGSQNAILNPAAGVTPSTPVVSDKYPAQIVTPDEAAGKTSVVNAQANVIDPRVPTPAPVAPSQVTGGQGFFGGDLTQGPPGTKPNGTEDEPYWPKTDKDVALLPPGANYIDPKDQSQKVTPGTPIPAPAAAPAAATPTSTDQTAIQPSLDDWNKLADSIFPSADSKAKTAAPAGPVSMVNPDGTPIPDRIQAVDGNDPAAIIIHHTGDHHTAPQTKAVLDQRGLGVELTVDRDGNIVQIGAPGAQNIKTGWGPKGTGLNNSNIVGIEVAANDDGDVLPVQIQAVKNYLAARGYGNIPVYGHGEVNPGHKEADEGMTVVNSIRADRASGAAAPTGEPGTTPIETLVKLDQSGLNVTHFGYEKPGEEGYDPDSAKGNGKYVENLIPGYDVALNSAGAALVGNPKPGETFTYAGREWRYGDAVSEKLTDPRFDIFDPTGAALTGSVPVGRQVAAAAPAGKEDWTKIADNWVKASPEELAAGQKQNVATLDNLNRSTQNPGEFWKIVSKPIQGVPDDLRQQYADNFKKEVIKNAQEFYGEKDPEKAFARATSDPGFEAYVSNVGRGLAGAVGQADIGIGLMGKNIDNNRVDGFAKLVHPESTGEGRAGFIKTLTDIQDVHHRHDVFNEIYGNLDQNTKDAIGDPASILDSIDHLADPKYQADLNKAISTKKAWVDQQLAGDPSLRGTSAGWWTTGTGENIFNTVAAIVPGGIGAVVRTSTLGAQIYSSNMDRIAQEHPSWSSAQVSDEASRSAFLQLAPQEAVMAASHGLTAPLLKWAGALAEKPIVRFGIGGGVQVGAAAIGGAAGQVGENVAENKPLLTNVPQAVGSAVVQSLPFAVHGGIHGVAEGPPVKPEVREPISDIPLTENTKLPRNVVGGGAETAVPSEPTPILTPNRAVRTSDVLGSEPGPRQVSTSDVLGPQEDYTPQEPLPWYKQGVAPADRQDPLVIRGAERTTFTPQELSDAISRMPGGTPEELRTALERLVSPTSVHLGEESETQKGGEIQKARTAQVFQPESGPQFWKSDKQRTQAEQAWIKSRGGEPIADQIARERAAAKLGGTPRPPASQEPTTTGSPPPAHGNISGEDPYVVREARKTMVDGVANRYQMERTAAGELPRIDPNEGFTTGELLARAVKMSPEEINQHVADIMQNKITTTPKNTAAAVRAKEMELTQRSRQLGLLSEENPGNAQMKQEADAALKKLGDFHSAGGPIAKMKEIFNHLGVGLQGGDLQHDLSTENGLKEKFYKEKGKAPPPSADPTHQGYCYSRAENSFQRVPGEEKTE